MKSFIKKSFSLILLLCFMFVGLSLFGFSKVNAASATASFDPSHFTGQGVSGSGGAISATVDGIIVSNNKGFGTTQIRMYSGSTITITSTLGNISEISFTFSGSYTGGLSTSYTGLDVQTWSQSLSSQARFMSIVVTYDSAGSKSISLGADTYTMIGNNLTLVPVTNDITDPLVWTSSDDSIATVTGGVVSPVTTGTVTITASAEGVNDSVDVKIYPDNSSDITIAAALDICTFTGSTSTPYTYITRGTVAADPAPAENQFTLTDGVNTIIVFKYGHNKSAGSEVIVSGYLVNYGGTTKEFSGSVEFLSEYTVTFDSDGGTTVAPQTIYGGRKVTKPSDPTKDDYTFEGWFNESVEWDFDSDTVNSTFTLTAHYHKNVNTVTFNSNGGSAVDPQNVAYGAKAIEPSDPTRSGYNFDGWYDGDSIWDFDNDLVINDLTLIAHWSSPALLLMQSDLNDVEAFLRLGYKYDISSVTDTLDGALTEVTGNSYTSWSGKSDTSSAVYAGNSAGSYGSIQLRSNNSNSGIIQTTSGGNVRKVTVVWDSHNATGRTLNIYGNNTAYLAPTDLYNDSTDGTLLGTIVYGTSTELSIDGEYAYIGIRSNDGAIYLTSVDIQMSSYENVDFRLQCGVDEILQLVGDGLPGIELGIEVSAGGKVIKKPLTDELIHYDSTEGIKYIVVSLGDLLNNIDRFDVEFTVRAYATFDNVSYYSTQSKTYSVLDMIKEYNTSGPQSVKDAIAGLVGILTNLGKMS